MGTSASAALRALAAARAAQAATSEQEGTLADVLTESKRAADNSQVLVDELMGPTTPAEPDPEPDPEADPEPETEQVTPEPAPETEPEQPDTTTQEAP